MIEWILKNTELTLSVKDNDGATIIHLASKFNQIALLDWIFKNFGTSPFKELSFNGASCLHFACSNNSLNAVKKLLQILPNLINIQMMNGITA